MKSKYCCSHRIPEAPSLLRGNRYCQSFDPSGDSLCICKHVLTYPVFALVRIEASYILSTLPRVFVVFLVLIYFGNSNISMHVAQPHSFS